jgi:hypothetical protein
MAVIKVKVKQLRYRPEQAQRVNRGIAIPFLDLSPRMWYVVSIKLRSLYSREIPGTYYTDGWVGPRAGLDMCEFKKLYYFNTGQ